MRISQRRKDQLISQENKRYEEIQKQQFEEGKGLRVAQVGMDTQSAIMGAWRAAMAIPNIPVAIAVGSATSAMLGGLGIATAAKINAQQFATGGYVGGVMGGPQGPDNRNIVAGANEYVMTVRDQKQFLSALNGRGGRGGVNISQGNIIIQGNATQDTIDDIRAVSDDRREQLRDDIIALQAAGEL